MCVCWRGKTVCFECVLASELGLRNVFEILMEVGTDAADVRSVREIYQSA